MRSLLIATVAASLLANTGSKAYDLAFDRNETRQYQTRPHEVQCTVPLPDNFWDNESRHFRADEEWAWKQICLGLEADMLDLLPTSSSADDKTCGPSIVGSKGKASTRRALRPEFLELILIHQPWASAPRYPRVRIRNAHISGNVKLEGHEISSSFEFTCSKIDGNLNLKGSTFKRSLILQNSIVKYDILAEDLEVKGNFILRNGEFKRIDLHPAKVSGNMNLAGSNVEHLDAGHILVGGSLSLSGIWESSRWSYGRFAKVELVGSRIGGSIGLYASIFNGELDLTGAMVQGELLLSDGENFCPPIWGDNAVFILRNAEVGALLADKRAWEIKTSDIGDEAALCLSQGDIEQAGASVGSQVKKDLIGFTYRRLGGFTSTDQDNMADAEAEWLVGWIKAQRKHQGEFNYDPQPYTALAQVLESAGAYDKAREIWYARYEHKIETDELNLREILLLLAGKYLFGYGLYPVWSLYWFLGLVAIGGGLAQFSKERSLRGWIGIWYSLENALPIIETTERFKTIEHGCQWLVHFFHLQKVVGFVIATIVVGALTLLGE